MNFKGRILHVMLLLAIAVTFCACKADVTEETQQRNPVIMPKQDYVETPYVDYSLSDLPEFVDDISQCTDQEKRYVLPDGYLYEYGMTFIPSATNQLLLATDSDGALFNGCGYQDRARIRSNLEIGESDFSFITGFIPVKTGDVLYFGDDCFHVGYEQAHVMYTVLYDSDKKVLAQASMKDVSDSFFDVLETNAAGYITAVRISEEYAPAGLAYMQLTLIGSGAQKIISVNEPLDEGQESLAWGRTEQYIASAWCAEIAATVETVNAIELPDPGSAIRFVFATDIHVDPDPSESYTNHLGRVCAEVMRSGQIPFFITGGDNCTQSSGYMPTVFEGNMEVLLEQLEPIPQKNILLSVGNHDGATGSCEENGETVYYRYQLTNEQRSSVFLTGKENPMSTNTLTPTEHTIIWMIPLRKPGTLF